MVLGITGYSGAGKHTAANFLSKRGWAVLDADSLAHDLYRPYTNVWKAIVETFGEKILNQDDSINRGRLGKIVFDVDHPGEAAQSLEKLNAIVHPYIRRRLEEEIHHLSHKGTNVAVVAALWKELDLRGLCEKLLWVKADPALAMRRIEKRDGISPEVYALRVKNQTPPAETDWVLENNGTPEELGATLASMPGL